MEPGGTAGVDIGRALAVGLGERGPEKPDPKNIPEHRHRFDVLHSASRLSVPWGGIENVDRGDY
jgi:hypothetical protein